MPIEVKTSADQERIFRGGPTVTLFFFCFFFFFFLLFFYEGIKITLKRVIIGPPAKRHLTVIHSTCIKLARGFKAFVSSIFEWTLKTGFHVLS